VKADSVSPVLYVFHWLFSLLNKRFNYARYLVYRDRVKC